MLREVMYTYLVKEFRKAKACHSSSAISVQHELWPKGSKSPRALGVRSGTSLFLAEFLILNIFAATYTI